MLSAQESTDIRKAMAYDLMIIFREDREKAYTCDEIEQIIQTYIAGLSK